MSDTQQGFRWQFTDNWCTRAARDIVKLRHFADGHLHTGDCIEWSEKLPEDEKYRAFRREMLLSGRPYLDTPGNHDLTTYNPDAPRRIRSANEWAAEVPGRSIANQEMVLGDVVVLGISPHYWRYIDKLSIDGKQEGNYDEPDPLSPDILTWLDSKLTEHSSKRVWFASHALPATQFSDKPMNSGNIRDWAQIENLVSGHQNLAGWFSGHWHIDAADKRSIRSILVGGRRIHGVNAPSSAGLFPNIDYGPHQWTRYAGSLYVTDMGDDIEVRWRNHLSARWERPFGEYVKIYSTR
ncbi:hypothetical protein G7068_11025 [Leucobacter viscericola]|uniref:Uncharacterized protein n=1 Tax=Leucobacter viscericola TaxID=2714935 RepID=A0A6G7XH02_9MICO|nr:metallophosphoesterase [Leucobacter viscericola]QIK63667.1 hypothetical protein G7068_11025 [Leucobacter viscericola]